MIPDQASTLAVPVDTLFFTLLGLATFFAVLVIGLIVIFAFKYRRRSEDEVPEQIEGSPRLEVLWTVVPTGLALVVFVWASTLYLSEGAARRCLKTSMSWEAMDMADPARQRKAGSRRAACSGRTARPADDDCPRYVIHSFFVPAFRIKQDVLPGRYTTTWFQASQVGTYTMFCAEYCGLHLTRGCWHR